MSIRERALRALGAGPLIEACEFYSERARGADVMRGTAGRWAPGVHPAPQPNVTIHGRPSIWDQGTIAQWALTAALGTQEPTP